MSRTQEIQSAVRQRVYYHVMLDVPDTVERRHVFRFFEDGGVTIDRVDFDRESRTAAVYFLNREDYLFVLENAQGQELGAEDEYTVDFGHPPSTNLVLHRYEEDDTFDNNNRNMQV